MMEQVLASHVTSIVPCKTGWVQGVCMADCNSCHEFFWQLKNFIKEKFMTHVWGVLLRLILKGHNSSEESNLLVRVIHGQLI
jgi:hypothetical protein